MSSYHPYTIFPLGDAALTVEFGNSIHPSIHERVLSMFYQLQAAQIPYITDLVPAYASLTIHYDVRAVQQPESTVFEVIAEMIGNLAEEETKKPATSGIIEIPVCYETAFAPDMYVVSQHTNLSPEEIIAMHTEKEYRVYMLGFLPGFAYMGEVDAQMHVPRKPTPQQVLGGAVGLAGAQTGIYPFETQGGWQIIGRTPVTMFDAYREQPSLLRVGDKVKFYSITANEFEDHQRRNA